MLKQVEFPTQSPEELLRFLESERALRQHKAEKTHRNRAALLVFGLLLLVGGTAAALLLLFSMLRDLPHRDPQTSQVCEDTGASGRWA